MTKYRQYWLMWKLSLILTLLLYFTIGLPVMALNLLRIVVVFVEKLGTAFVYLLENSIPIIRSKKRYAALATLNYMEHRLGRAVRASQQAKPNE